MAVIGNKDITHSAASFLLSSSLLFFLSCSFFLFFWAELEDRLLAFFLDGSALSFLGFESPS